MGSVIKISHDKKRLAISLLTLGVIVGVGFSVYRVLPLLILSIYNYQLTCLVAYYINRNELECKLLKLVVQD